MIERVRAAIREVLDSKKAEAIAAKMGVSHSTVLGWGEVGRKPPSLERLAQFLHATEDDRPLNALRAEGGGVFLPLPKSGPDTEPALLRAVKESADVIQVAATALQDGKVTPAELVKVRRELAEAQRAFAALGAALERKAGNA